jgi:hypothetical protein
MTATKITELLNLKATVDTERKKQVNELDEQKRKAEQERIKLRDQKYSIEDQIRTLECHITDTELETIELIKKMEKPLFNLREAMLREIALTNLKHPRPGVFEMPEEHIERSHTGESILFDSTIARIKAKYSTSGNRVNVIEYKIHLFTNKNINIEKLNPFFKDGNWSYGKQIFSKYFKTLEDAKNYNSRNSEKHIREAIGHITGLINELNEASDNFEDVFDFRLFFGDTASRHYSGDRNYQIESRTKNTMELTEMPNWNGEKRNVKILVRNVGFDFGVTGGDEKDREQILGFLENTFNLQHHSIGGSHD